jgi:hypothetical protein
MPITGAFSAAVVFVVSIDHLGAGAIGNHRKERAIIAQLRRQNAERYFIQI